MSQDTVPLSDGEQTRNVILFSLNKTLIYVGAPVLYVGITQTALCRRLGANDIVANLPSTVYAAMLPVPIVIAWYYCSTRVLKPVLIATYLIVAAFGGFVAALLLLQVPANLLIAAVVAHAAVLGCGLGVVAPFEWEVLGKGVAPARRGAALSLAFGVGPVFAFLSSLASQLILDGKIALPFLDEPLRIPGLDYPLNFAILYGASVPLMAIAAVAASRFVVPVPTEEPARPPFLTGIFGGLFDFLRSPNILVVCVATILVAAGYYIISTLSLFTEVALEAEPARYAGYQNALRFGCKIGAGLLLGWLLMLTNPRFGLLATATFCIMAVLWALFVPGMWYLLAFGLLGAGELFGVYYPNYILCCSPKVHIRRNMIFERLLYLPAASMPVVYGTVTQLVTDHTGDARRGFQMSFILSLTLLALAFLLALTLPARPRPSE